MTDKLEPGCNDRDLGYQRSAAISLKRIADALDRISPAEGLGFLDNLSGVLSDRIHDLGLTIQR